MGQWLCTQQIQKVVSNGTLPTIEIMRRGGGKGSGPGKEGSETSSDSDSSPSASNPAKTTGEEREAAYLEAHARIFKDVVGSPPETQASNKQEEAGGQCKGGESSGRSQL